MEALRLYGKNWRKVEEHIGTRNAVQARTHAQKFFGKALDKGNPFEVTPAAPIKAEEKPKAEAITSNQLPAVVESTMTEREKEYFQNFVATPSQSNCSTAFSSPADPKDKKVMVNELLSTFGAYGQNTHKSPFQVQKIVDGKEAVNITGLKRGRKVGNKNKRAYNRKERPEKIDGEILPPDAKRVCLPEE